MVVPVPKLIELDGIIYVRSFGGRKAATEGVGLSLNRRALMLKFGRLYYLYVQSPAPQKIEHEQVLETFYPDRPVSTEEAIP